MQFSFPFFVSYSCSNHMSMHMKHSQEQSSADQQSEQELKRIKLNHSNGSQSNSLGQSSISHAPDVSTAPLDANKRAIQGKTKETKSSKTPIEAKVEESKPIDDCATKPKRPRRKVSKSDRSTQTTAAQIMMPAMILPIVKDPFVGLPNQHRFSFEPRNMLNVDFMQYHVPPQVLDNLPQLVTKTAACSSSRSTLVKQHTNDGHMSSQSKIRIRHPKQSEEQTGLPTAGIPGLQLDDLSMTFNQPVCSDFSITSRDQWVQDVMSCVPSRDSNTVEGSDSTDSFMELDDMLNEYLSFQEKTAQTSQEISEHSQKGSSAQPEKPKDAKFRRRKTKNGNQQTPYRHTASQPSSPRSMVVISPSIRR